MAEVYLPATLPPLFVDLPRRVSVDAMSVAEAIEQLNKRWPGIQDRLCDPGPELRAHINVYVDRQPAELTSALTETSRLDVVAAITGG